MTQPVTTTKPGAAVTVTAVALGVDMFLYGSLVPLLPLLPAVAGSPSASGVLFAVYALALLAATPLVGVWVDRAGPRAPMLAGLAGLAAATVLFLVSTGVPGPVGLVLLSAARAAQGTAAAASWTAGLALVAATHEPDRRGRAMGTALSAVGIGVLLGPAASGLLSAAFGLWAPFALVAVVAAGDAAARIILIKPVTTPEPVRSPYRSLTGRPLVFLLIGLTAMGAAAIAFPEPLLPLHLHGLGLGAIAIGLAFAVAALSGSLAAPLAGALADRMGATKIAATGAVTTAAGFLLAGRETTWVSVAGLVVIGFGAQLVLAPTLVLVGVLAEATQPPAYGAAYALYNIAYSGGLAVAPLAGGLTAGAVGVPATTVFVACLALLLAVVLFVRRDRS